jgi:hypothetical protein
MSRGLKIKITLVTLSTIIFCLFEKYVLKHELNIGTVITVLVCILPITFLSKFPKNE